MAGKYQDSMELFRRIYFKEDGTLDTEGYSEIRVSDKKAYSELACDYSLMGDGRSRIVGKSAFTPRILKKAIMKQDAYDKEEIVGYRYFLTLDNQGKFDHHFDSFYRNNQENIQEIDITDMSQEEIMEKVEQILNMSNEEIMTMFNIQKTYSTKTKIELLVDDIVQKYFEQQGQKIKETAYGPEWGMRTVADKGAVEQGNVACQYDEARIFVYPTSRTLGETSDMIFYRILDRDEYDISKIKIEIKEANVNSELGQLILQTLQERFTERQNEEEKRETESEQTTEEKTGAERIIEFMEKNNLAPHDLSLALSMTLARNMDKTNAEQHIVKVVSTDDREDPENNNKSEQK